MDDLPKSETQKIKDRAAALNKYFEPPIDAFRPLSEQVLKDLRKRKLQPPDAVSTGFPSWDRMCRDSGGGKGLAHGWYAIIGGGANTGKALALDTAVPTPTGWTTMGEIQVGDELFDEAGSVCRVTFATDTQWDRRCYVIEFSDGTSVVADAAHRWLTRSKVGKGKWAVRTTEDICLTQWVPWSGAPNHRLPDVSALETEEAELPIGPYTLGVWLGDGMSREAMVHLHHQDYEVVAAMRCEGTPVVKRQKVDNVQAWRLSTGGRSQGARADSVQARLRALGLLQNKHIPPAYLRASAGQRLALLQGLMDSDGHCDVRGYCEFITTTEALADGFIELCRTLGIKPHTTKGMATLDGREVSDKWRIGFVAYTGFPVFRLTRKANRQTNAPPVRPRSRSRHIVAVYETESVPVRCIQVDSPSHLFLAGKGMVPTHNTMLALNLAVAAMRAGENVTMISLEMAMSEVSTRLSAIASQTDVMKLEYGDTFDEEAAERADDRLLELPGGFTLNDVPIRNIDDIAKVMDFFNKMEDSRFFIVDFLQLVATGKPKDMMERVTEISERLRDESKRLNVTTIALSQLRRGASNERTVPPTIYDLLGGSALENSADQVALLNHANYKRDYQKRSATTEVILGKNRFGPTGTIPVIWDYRFLQCREPYDFE